MENLKSLNDEYGIESSVSNVLSSFGIFLEDLSQDCHSKASSLETHNPLFYQP